jgi:dTDP-4-amino-4,6-dideoxygalactose transaminase
VNFATQAKRSLRDLAVFGGTPAFHEPLHVGRPNVGDRAMLQARIDDLLDRRWLKNDGPYVREFEQRVAERTGVRHCVAMCNATTALQVLLRASGVGGEVIVPSFTFVATVHALAWQGIRPVFCDVDPATHCLNPGVVGRLVTPRTTAILGVHLWGRTCDVGALDDLAGRHGLKLLFDAAHAFGCTRAGQAVGSFGVAEVFSFHATKCLNTFEGGAIVTSDEALAREARRMRDHGHAAGTVAGLGTNGKMSEVSAAMGLTGLESFEGFTAHSRENAARYEKGLSGMPGVRLLPPPADGDSNYHYVVIEVDESLAGICRDRLLDVLRAENVLARRYFHPGCHRVEPYRSMSPECDGHLPVTRRLCRDVLALPTGTSVTVEHVDAVAGLIRFVVEHAAEVRRGYRHRGGTKSQPREGARCI